MMGMTGMDKFRTLSSLSLLSPLSTPDSRPPTPDFAGDVDELLAEPEGDVLLLDGGAEGGGTALALLLGHREGLVEGFGGAFDVGRSDDEGVLAELLGGTGPFREDEDAVALVDQGRLFGAEVHAVDDRVAQHHVVPLHRRQHAGIALAHDQVDWVP